MAVSEREKKLLLDFWEGNKPLLLAMLNVLKDDESIDEQERENMESMIITISNKSSNDFSKYLFKGNKYAKRTLVKAVVKEYVNSNQITFEELKKTFSDNLQGGCGVVQTVEYAENKDPVRYFMKSEEILITSDNVKFVVSNQWGIGNIDRFIKVATGIGYEITRVG